MGFWIGFFCGECLVAMRDLLRVVIYAECFLWCLLGVFDGESRLGALGGECKG